MKHTSMLFVLITAFVINSFAKDAPRLPSDAKLAKETILNVFRLASDCKTIDQVQLAFQPLIFSLYRHSDGDSSRVLIDLASYNVGEANGQILRCVLIRRGINDKGFASLVQKHVNDCGLQLGNDSRLCKSAEDQAIFIQGVMSNIKKKTSCELEY